jgi:hypothetical protein
MDPGRDLNIPAETLAPGGIDNFLGDFPINSEI